MVEKVEEQYKNTIIAGALFLFSLLVWFLAITWAPFGKPLPAWHWINGIISAALGLWTWYNYEKEKQ